MALLWTVSQTCYSCGHNLFNYQKAPSNFQVIETVLYPLMNTVIPGGRNRAEVYWPWCMAICTVVNLKW